MFKKVNENLKNGKWCISLIAFILLCCMIIIPLLNQGIMCGDELATRFYGMQGIGGFLKSVFNEQMEKGRALSAITLPLASGLGFLSSENYLFRVVQILTIFLDAGLFAYLIFKLEKNIKFSCFVLICIVSFLPITFENTAPNAFCTLFNVPFAILLVSFILYLDYIDNGNRKKLVFSMLFLLIAEMSYETFIAFTPIFLFILLLRFQLKRDFKKILTHLSVPFCVSCFYLVLYFVCSSIYVSNYSGNQFGTFDISNTLEIIWQLFKVSFPGYFLFGSQKYKFLLNIYKDYSAGEMVRIVILAMAFAVLFLILFQKKEFSTKCITFKNICIVFGGLISVILPALPISVAEMYQGNVGDNGFVALPITYFSYYFAVFVLCYIVWFILKNKAQSYIALIIACFFLMGVQFSNGVFSQEQNRNFERLQSMENCLKTDLFKSFGNAEFVSQDMFKTMNSMAIYDSYWSQFANLHGSGIMISNREISGEENRIYYRYNKMYVWYGEDLYVLTPDMIVDKDIIIDTDENCGFTSYENPVGDHGLNVYHFSKNGL